MNVVCGWNVPGCAFDGYTAYGDSAENGRFRRWPTQNLRRGDLLEGMGKRWIEIEMDTQRNTNGLNHIYINIYIYAHLENKHPPIVFFVYFFLPQHTTSVCSAFFKKKNCLPHFFLKTHVLFKGQKTLCSGDFFLPKPPKKHTHTHTRHKTLTGWVLLLHPDV